MGHRIQERMCDLNAPQSTLSLSPTFAMFGHEKAFFVVTTNQEKSETGMRLIETERQEQEIINRNGQKRKNARNHHGQHKQECGRQISRTNIAVYGQTRTGANKHGRPRYTRRHKIKREKSDALNPICGRPMTAQCNRPARQKFRMSSG